jgi:hypothetical protein
MKDGKTSPVLISLALIVGSVLMIFNGSAEAQNTGQPPEGLTPGGPQGSQQAPEGAIQSRNGTGSQVGSAPPESGLEMSLPMLLAIVIGGAAATLVVVFGLRKKKRTPTGLPV